MHLRLIESSYNWFLQIDWVSTSREQALASNDPTFVYVSEKALAEQAVWEFAEKHPNIDVTTCASYPLPPTHAVLTADIIPPGNPPFFIGPFAPNYRFTDALIREMSTNGLLYQLLNPAGTFFAPLLLLIDVRDVARATVHALTTPPAEKRKRLLFVPHSVSWKQAAELIAEARPQLKERLSKAAQEEGKYPHPAPPTPVDNSKAIGVLKLGQLNDWKTTILAGVDSLLKVEADFAKEGKTFH